MTVDSWLFKLLTFYGTRLHHRGQWRILGLLRRWLRADVDAELEVVRDGHRWVLNPADYVRAELFWFGLRDPWDVFHAKTFLRPGSVVFDIGANFGHYSITLGDAINRQCSVHAFEPFPENLARLRKNIALNNMAATIHVHPVGLSDAVGIGVMTTRMDNSGSATLARTGVEDGFEVQLTTLDAFCLAEQIDRVDFMKIDVEGFETKLLDGAVDTIDRHHPTILIELDPPKLTRAGSSVEILASTLRSFGYTLYVANRKRLVPLESLPQGQDILNAFCICK